MSLIGIIVVAVYVVVILAYIGAVFTGLMVTWRINLPLFVICCFIPLPIFFLFGCVYWAGLNLPLKIMEWFDSRK